MYELEVSGIVIKTANTPQELREWATLNVGDYWEIYRIGVVTRATRHGGPGYKLTVDQADRIRQMRQRGFSIRSIGQQFRCAEETVRKAIKNKI